MFWNDETWDDFTGLNLTVRSGSSVQRVGSYVSKAFVASALLWSATGTAVAGAHEAEAFADVPAVIASSAGSDTALATGPVDAVVLKQWPEPCEEMFEYMAELAPNRFAEAIRQREFDPPELSLAAEAAARMPDAGQAMRLLVELSKHEKTYVREGAAYGLALLLPKSKAKLLAFQKREKVAEMKELIGELLEGCDTAELG